MSKKLSLKVLRSVILGAGEAGLTYDEIVEKLDAEQVTYTSELTLQGMIDESIKKGNFIRTDKGKDITKGTYAPKPRLSTGGGTPTHMFRLKNPLKPEDGTFIEKPYDKETVENDESGLWATTKLAAVKAAKKHFYVTVYFPQLEQYRQLEEQYKPNKDAAAPAEEPEAEQAEA